jgi:hypothetical protein
MGHDIAGGEHAGAIRAHGGIPWARRWRVGASGSTIIIMPNATMVEDRLAALEKEVATLKYRLAGRGPSADWLTQVAGSMQDEPDFDKVLELGRQARKGDTPTDDDPT